MTVTELIDRLTELRDDNGDQEVLMDTGPVELFVIGEVDMDADGNGIIIWKED